MILLKFADVSQPECSNWVRLQVKNACERTVWDGCVTLKNCFVKSLNNWMV